ncbi:hypothetical protein RB595_005942 [Gaeumannomyces hyphopodioides]
MAPNLTTVIGQYPVLQALAAHSSALDLFNLALSSKAHHDIIAASASRFRRLRASCLCDGHGLKLRQDQKGLYSPEWHDCGDEPIEVHIYAIQCDPSSSLPCIKCGVNICEECRYYPREPPQEGYPRRRPHLNSPWQHENVMALCPPCDEKQEVEIARPENFPETPLCSCDVYTRWICHPCKVKEDEFTCNYYEKCTHSDAYPYWDSEEGEGGNPGKLGKDFGGRTKLMPDHQHRRAVYCLCGSGVPDGMRPRCTWCKRRHLPESQWDKEWEEVGSKMPWFENDPCYPLAIEDNYMDPDVLYPKLKYDGPVYGQ